MALNLSERLERAWYNRTPTAQFLRPIAALFCGIVTLRRKAYLSGLLKSRRVTVPVIVIGNITVGGTGKTPLVIWLAGFLRNSGYRPGIVSRGYGGQATHWPQQVRPDSDALTVGDEAVVIARRTQCPMAVGPDRVADSLALLEHEDCDIILSDDGLQHYRLQRTLEIATIDGIRRFGNGFCLPSGPLREPPSRLSAVDFVVTKGMAGPGEIAMQLSGEVLVNLHDELIRKPLAEFRDTRVHAVAGIGNPARFFSMLSAFGLQVVEHAFADHHPFVEYDLEFDDTAPVIMTEKDAVKCRRFSKANHWYLPVEANLPKSFGVQLLNLLERKNG
jgi:tetraacyldisaccharide 4'-kinase